MTVLEYIKTLYEIAEERGELDNEIRGVCSGTCIMEGEDPFKKFHYIGLKTEGIEELRVIADYMPDKMSVSDIFACDYTSKNVVFDKLLSNIPASFVVKYIQRSEEQAIPARILIDERGYYASRFEGQRVAEVYGSEEKREITIVL